MPRSAPHVTECYASQSEDFVPLSNFKTLPKDLFAVPQPNGDIFLRYSNGQEAQFDVIGMVIGLCLEVPPGFPK